MQCSLSFIILFSLCSFSFYVHITAGEIFLLCFVLAISFEIGKQGWGEGGEVIMKREEEFF